VLAEFGDIQYLAPKRQALEIATDGMEKNLAKLKQHDHSLQHSINLHVIVYLL
jgi:hypothetical protein